ncbi:transient receptor potential cation channel protein painless [Culicoides brevitarsis]|uniref:transient receptor potential cation channel protein painless n=1 Tax=Culicoides brevitarsis TaxID=469753 RepID=UPI00307B2B76
MGPNDIQQCFQDPQAQLVEAAAKRNIQQVISALLNGANPDLADKQGNSVFENFCLKPDSRPFIEECIKNAANVSQPNKNGKFALNFAAESLDTGNLEAVVLAMKSQGVDLNVKYSNGTVLHHIANKINKENVAASCECILLLVENGANVNIPDQRDVTPVLALLKKFSTNEKIIRETLEFIFKHCNVDLDSFREGEARTRLNEKCPELAENAKKSSLDDVSIDLLVSQLKNRKEMDFSKGLRALMTKKGFKTIDELEANNLSGATLLEIAVEERQSSIVQLLLDLGANPNKFKSGTMPPLQLAAQRNSPEILEILLKSEKIKVNKATEAKSEPVLCTVIKQLGENPHSIESEPYRRCFDLLLAHKDIDVNEFDATTGNTALHFACRYRNRDVITKLLEKNAYIGMQNVLDSIAIDDIDPLVLENYFDSCIQANHFRLGDDDFNLFADFRCFAPPRTKDNTGSAVFHTEEMLPIVYLAKCKELRHLMTHPLITSFLFIKWHRLFSMFLLNLMLYSVFCVSLIVYVVFFYGRGAEEHGFLAGIFMFLTILGIFILAVREFMQFVINPKNYVKTLVNYLELLLIFMTFVVLVTTPENYREYGNTHRFFASFTILLAALELSLLISSLPNSFISMHIVMLKRVSYSFLKSLSINSVIILAFAFCFYTLFNDPTSVDGNKNSSTASPINENDDKADDFNRFVNPLTAIIKTIVMLTGEFEAASIDFDVNATSYLIFLIFVFFMSIVLFNLLNGLAVSDTQIIKAEAEVTHFSEKAATLHRFERSFNTRNLGVFGFFKQNTVAKYIRNKICVFPHFLPQNMIIVVPNQGNKILIPTVESAVDFNSGNDATTVLIDERGKDRKELTNQYCCLAPWNAKCCSRLDRKIVKRMMQVINNNERERHAEAQKASLEQRLAKMEVMMETMQQMLVDALKNK